MVTVPAALVAALLAFASAASGLPIPSDPLPTIQLTDRDPDGRPLGHKAPEYGVTFPTGEIYLSTEWAGGAEDNCVLAHELTHWLQLKNHLRQSARQDEVQAYTVTLRCFEASHLPVGYLVWARKMIAHPHIAKP